MAGEARGDDFAVGDDLVREAGGGGDEFREFAGDVAEVAGEESGQGGGDVELGADAVEFVFEPEACGVVRGGALIPCGGGGIDWGGEHGLDRLERDEGGFVETAVAGEDGGGAEVAVEHVGGADGVGRGVEGVRDGVFEETFLDAEAGVAGEDFDDVLCFARGEGAEGFGEDGETGGGGVSGEELVEESLDIGERPWLRGRAAVEDEEGGAAGVVLGAGDGAVGGKGDACGVDEGLTDEGGAGLEIGELGAGGGGFAGEEADAGGEGGGVGGAVEERGEERGFGGAAGGGGDGVADVGEGGEFARGGTWRGGGGGGGSVRVGLRVGG